MVKRQKEKQYQSAREHRANSQLRSGSSITGSAGQVQKRLPFSHCALTLVPYETPVCNRAGIVFENAAILPFLFRHKIDPVNGEPADSASLIRLNMDKNEEGASKIVAILQSEGKEASVYSYEAYQELNVKAKNYEDLLTGAKFDKKKDVIILYDPSDDELNRIRDINTFYHVQHARELAKNKESGSEVRHSVTATRIMEKLQKNKQEKQQADEKAAKKRKTEASTELSASSTTAYFVDGKRLRVLAEDVTGVKYTANQGAASSLTSTAVQVADKNEGREATDEEILQAQFSVMRKLKKKGYVRLRTNRGDMTLELHCEMAPRTCMNFLGLCRANKYDNSVFHRLIPNFMLQGGKPANEDENEDSLWGGSFQDEFDDRLKHTGGGIVSMANAGTNSNKRQFFLTFKSCNYLDRKHSVFGTIVDGKDVLTKLERIPADKKDRPREEIKILGTDVLVDPANEARELEQKRLEKLVASRQQPSKDGSTSDIAKPADVAKKPEMPEVGRYLKQKLKDPSKDKQAEGTDGSMPSRLPPPPKSTTFGNFSGW
jgi:peptidyl-prolyl cis-trans isomerase-like 2